MSRKASPLCNGLCLGLMVCGLAWWVSFRIHTGVTNEDALITYRYAQNLASGNGFVFNSGERVLGTTTPLLTVLLALIGGLLGPSVIPLASTLIMTGFGALTAVLGYHILWRLHYPRLVCLVSIPIFFGSAHVLSVAVGGMETPMVLFFMAASGYLLLQRHYTMCFVMCSLLVLTRPDGIIWSGLMCAVVVARLRRLPWKSVLVAVALVLPWLLFAMGYFGSPLPHSIAAKQVIGASRRLPSCLSFAGLKHFGGWYLKSTGYGKESPVLALWLLVLALGAVSVLRRREHRLLGIVMVAFPVLYGLFLFLGRAPHFFWYLTPAVWCWILVGTVGTYELSVLTARHLVGSGPSLTAKSLIACTIILLYCISQNLGVIEGTRKSQANEYHTRRAVGLWLRENTPDSSVVAMEAIGYQAFFSRRRVIDLAGLVSPAVVRLRLESESNAEHFHKVLSRLRPDYIVLRSFEVDENQHYHGGRLFPTERDREHFERDWAELKRFAAPYPETWGPLAFLTVYGRRDAPFGGNEGFDGEP